MVFVLHLNATYILNLLSIVEREEERMRRKPCCEKEGMKRGPWTPEEDEALVQYISKNGPGSWRALPKLAGEFMRSSLTILLLSPEKKITKNLFACYLFFQVNLEA